MFKKICYSLIVLVLMNTSVLSEKVFIYATVNDKIITNYDIKKEIEYLKILNPKLVELSKKEIFNISKNSLINEIIKKSEIEIFLEIKEENPLVNDYYKNLYTKLNFNNESDFEKSLLSKIDYTSNDIKKKLEIELMWNELVYLRYGNQVKIDKDSLIKKIQNIKNKEKNEYLLSEIVFEKKKDEDFDTLVKKIKSSISEIGFNNTANIYSISNSSKLGGNIGWIEEYNLSNLIFNNLKLLSEGQFTDVIQMGNNFLILKIEKIRSKKISINKKEELSKMINIETNKQLNQFSRIYFDKTKINYSINEN
ncbi:peptidylprolyl isomerase [Pelagibacterales bacterium SAG-MED01]|nr:peptidylprolyl isomerase [Pelagibacterales bacterium SAG-MED01]